MTQRVPLIAGNWKMHKTGTQAVEAALALKKRVQRTSGVEVLIAPTFTALHQVARAIKDSAVALGAQHLHWEKEGAFTGEISADMLVDAGCSHVIIGHSERRQFFDETDATANRRIQAASAAGLVPIFCIGETEAQRDAGETFSVLDKQVGDGLTDCAFDDPAGLIIAYEPVWAIGTGKSASRQQAQEAHQHIRSHVAELFGKSFADGVRILYGGSVKPDNISALMEMTDVDGALVGGASLDPETFSRLALYNQ
jgi:triosephosphate isomerase